MTRRVGGAGLLITNLELEGLICESGLLRLLFYMVISDNVSDQIMYPL